MNKKTLQAVFEKVEALSFLVLGDIILDEYYYTEIDRISPEAPVPIAKVNYTKSTLGGAANVAANLKSLGANAEIFGLIGNDYTGEIITQQLQEQNIIFHKSFIQKNFPSIVKTRIIAKNQQVIRVDKEEKSPVDKDLQKKFISYLEENITKYNGVLLSDYNKGFFDIPFSKDIISVCNKKHIPIFVDAKRLNIFEDIFLLKPNLKEAEMFSGIKAQKDLSNLESIFTSIAQKTNVKHIVITLSEKGMAWFDKEKVISVKTHPKEVYDVSGAGDTVLASLAIANSLDLSKEESLHFANLNAEIVIGILGTAVITPKMVYKYIDSHFLYNSNE